MKKWLLTFSIIIFSIFVLKSLTEYLLKIPDDNSCYSVFIFKRRGVGTGNGLYESVLNPSVYGYSTYWRNNLENHTCFYVKHECSDGNQVLFDFLAPALEMKNVDTITGIILKEDNLIKYHLIESNDAYSLGDHIGSVKYRYIINDTVEMVVENGDLNKAYILDNIVLHDNGKVEFVGINVLH